MSNPLPIARVTAVGAGALAGYYFGAESALGGAVAGQAVVEAIDHADLLRGRGEKRVGLQRGAVLSLAAKQCGVSTAEFVELASRDPEVQMLAKRSLDAAGETAWRAKLALLGALLADTALLHDRGQLQVRMIETAAIEAIEEPHLAVLSAAAEPRAAEEPDGFKDSHDYSHLQEALPGLRTVLDPILATLLAHGLLIDVTPGTWASVEDRPHWRPTELGLRVLESIRQASATLDASQDPPG